MSTFPGGIHPESFKEQTKNVPIKKAKPPKLAVIPLSQHVGAACQPTVSVGDEVKVGSLIGKSEKFISSYIHSSVAGKVKRIEQRPHPVLGKCNSIVIDSNEKDEVGFTQNESSVDNIAAEELRNRVREAGIAGLGGACFPTHVKLTPPKGKKIDTFILNGAECEPYLSCDHRLMLERTEEILKGALLIMKAVGVSKGIVAIEDNKPDAIEAMRSEVRRQKSEDRLQVESLKTKYPQGGEKQLIKTLLNREVPPNGLPFDVGCLVDNVATAFSIYEAVYLNKPLYERVVTICGSAIKQPSNLLVRIGTPIANLIEECGGLSKDLGKIIFGGPMTGFCQYSKETPIVKGTSGIIFLDREEAIVPDQQYCIRCGECVNVCPVNLVPTTIALAAGRNRLDIAHDFNATDCIECGACAYMCPSKIPLLHLIRKAKKGILCEIIK